MLFSACDKDIPKAIPEPIYIEDYLLREDLDVVGLKKCDTRQLRLIRNAIFAKYGYKFKSDELSEYFSKFDWYQPKYNNIDSFLTPIDIRNIQVIKTFEALADNGKLNKKLTIERPPFDKKSFKLPNNVGNFIKEYGKPNGTFVGDDDSPSPTRQLLYWVFPNSNLMLHVQSNSYGSVISYSAKARLIAIEQPNNEISSESRFEFIGIKFGDDETRVRDIIENYIMKNKEYKMEEINSGLLFGISDDLERIDKPYTILLTNEDNYFYFNFNKNGKFIRISLSSINVYEGC